MRPCSLVEHETERVFPGMPSEILGTLKHTPGEFRLTEDYQRSLEADEANDNCQLFGRWTVYCQRN